MVLGFFLGGPAQREGCVNCLHFSDAHFVFSTGAADEQGAVGVRGRLQALQSRLHDVPGDVRKASSQHEQRHQVCRVSMPVHVDLMYIHVQTHRGERWEAGVPLPCETQLESDLLLLGGKGMSWRQGKVSLQPVCFSVVFPLTEIPPHANSIPSNTEDGLFIFTMHSMPFGPTTNAIVSTQPYHVSSTVLFFLQHVVIIRFLGLHPHWSHRTF